VQHSNRALGIEQLKSQSVVFRKAKYICKFDELSDDMINGRHKKDLVISECLRIQTLEGNQGVKKAAL
jgi:hypothetical protein